MTERMSIKPEEIQLLDCTLRDGGLGLEDAAKNQLADLAFSAQDIERMIMHLNRSGLDIVELGSIEKASKNGAGYAIYPDVESLSAVMPADPNRNTLYVGLFRGPDTPLEEIPDWHEGLCRGLRVIMRYSELEKSIRFCEALSAKGYQVFVQPMLTMRYTDEELERMIRSANRSKAYALYFVDSYGYMTDQDVCRLFHFYDERLDPQIRIGFHAHNNMNLAFANVRTFLSIDTCRRRIVDACAVGMGQGAGNLQTEIIADYLCGAAGKEYRYQEILEVCEIVEHYGKPGLWGYSVSRLLSAIHRTAYKYAVSLREHYHLSYGEMNEILAGVPEELRHRYTPDNTKALLRLHGYTFREGMLHGKTD